MLLSALSRKRILSQMPCEVVEAVHVEDAAGFTCGKLTQGRCIDCGFEVCGDHRKVCLKCLHVFCPMCLAFHQRSGVHLKRPVQPDKRKPREKPDVA